MLCADALRLLSKRAKGYILVDCHKAKRSSRRRCGGVGTRATHHGGNSSSSIGRNSTISSCAMVPDHSTQIAGDDCADLNPCTPLERLVVGAAILGVAAAACLVWGRSDVRMGGVPALLEAKAKGSLWGKGYLFASPGQDNLNYEFEQDGGLHVGSGARAARSAQLRLADSAGHMQMLCGTGPGCESENKWEIKVAMETNGTLVNDENFSENRTVSNKTMMETYRAMDMYDRELDFDKEFRAGSPYNAFKAAGKKKQQSLREMLPPGSTRIKRGGETKTHKLCTTGPACEDWSDQQIKVAEMIDHDTVNQNRPEPPTADTIGEVQRAMEEQRINPVRKSKHVAAKVSVPLPPQ